MNKLDLINLNLQILRINHSVIFKKLLLDKLIKYFKLVYNLR